MFIHMHAYVRIIFTIFYNLVPDTYRFYVRAVNSLGEFSKIINTESNPLVISSTPLPSVENLRITNINPLIPNTWFGPDVTIAWDGVDETTVNGTPNDRTIKVNHSSSISLWKSNITGATGGGDVIWIYNNSSISSNGDSSTSDGRSNITAPSGEHGIRLELNSSGDISLKRTVINGRMDGRTHIGAERTEIYILWYAKA